MGLWMGRVVILLLVLVNVEGVAVVVIVMIVSRQLGQGDGAVDSVGGWSVCVSGGWVGIRDVLAV